MIADEVKCQVASALATIPDKRKEAVQQLFRSATPSAQRGIRTVVYDAVENVMLDLVGTAVLGETINNHVDQIFETGKVVAAIGKKFLCKDELLAPIASLVQTQNMDAIKDQRGLDIFGSPFMATRAK